MFAQVKDVKLLLEWQPFLAEPAVVTRSGSGISERCHQAGYLASSFLQTSE